MTLIGYTQQAFLYFITPKLRAFLAMLRIQVGTAAIVTQISSSQLATEAAFVKFKAANNLYQQNDKRTTSSSQKNEIALSTWRQIPAFIPSV